MFDVFDLYFVGLQREGTTKGDNDIIFKHNIRLQTPTCNCEESESFKSLLYRVNGLEEEVNYLKTQCTQGCCGGGSVGGKHKHKLGMELLLKEFIVHNIQKR